MEPASRYKVPQLIGTLITAFYRADSQYLIKKNWPPGEPRRLPTSQPLTFQSDNLTSAG